MADRTASGCATAQTASGGSRQCSSCQNNNRTMALGQEWMACGNGLKNGLTLPPFGGKVAFSLAKSSSASLQESLPFEKSIVPQRIKGANGRSAGVMLVDDGIVMQQQNWGAWMVPWEDRRMIAMEGKEWSSIFLLLALLPGKRILFWPHFGSLKEGQLSFQPQGKVLPPLKMVVKFDLSQRPALFCARKLLLTTKNCLSPFDCTGSKRKG